jgi:sec-independent protein translocase protein TatB
MDSFFGIGLPELILILIIAGLVMGPERLGQTARWLGRIIAQLQSISRGFVRQLNAELDAIDPTGELKATRRELQDLRRQMDDLRKEVTTEAQRPFQEGQQALRETREELERTIGSLESGAPAKTTGAAPADSPASTLPARVEVDDDPEP